MDGFRTQHINTWPVQRCTQSTVSQQLSIFCQLNIVKLADVKTKHLLSKNIATLSLLQYVQTKPVPDDDCRRGLKHLVSILSYTINPFYPEASAYELQPVPDHFLKSICQH